MELRHVARVTNIKYITILFLSIYHHLLQQGGGGAPIAERCAERAISGQFVSM